MPKVGKRKANLPVRQSEDERHIEEFTDLVRRAQAGDNEALSRLKPVLDDPEGARILLHGIGDMAVQAQSSMVRAFVGENLLAREALRRRMASLDQDLAGPNPSPLVALLAEQAVTCWLHLYYAEARHAQAMEDGITLTQAEFHQRRLDHAQRRYLRALKTLAQVRRLLLPVMQVNIAEQQVNVLDSGASNRPGTALRASRPERVGPE